MAGIKKAFLSIVSGCFLLSALAQAQSISEAAANGDSSAQFMQAVEALDSKQDANTVEKWLTWAAEQGHVKAQYLLANLYVDGQVLPRNYGKALYWGRKAAESGHRMAQYSMGLMNEYGWGTPKSMQAARQWYNRASAAGSPSAIARLELLNRQLQDRQVKSVKYRDYLRDRATRQGDALAAYWIGYAYLNGEGVKKNNDRAFAWLTQSANRGNAYAEYDLAYLYPIGKGVKPEYQPAVELTRRAAAQGHVKAMLNYGGYYELGYGVEPDWLQAARLYIAAAGLGNANAVNRLAGMEKHCRQRDVPVCRNFSIDKAVSVSRAEDLYRIGLMLQQGDGLPQNYGEAVRWLGYAARKAQPQAQYELAEMHENGLGTRRSKRDARYWYAQSSANGYSKGEKKLLALR